MWLSSFVILRWFDFSSFVKRLNMVFMPLLHDRYVEFGSFRKFMGFSASHVYIFDNKGSEIFTAA